MLVPVQVQPAWQTFEAATAPMECVTTHLEGSCSAKVALITELNLGRASCRGLDWLLLTWPDACAGAASLAKIRSG